MYPILFRLPEWFPLLGGEPITSFGMMVFLSFVVAGFVVQREMKRVGLDPDLAWDLLFWAVLGGMAGAKLYYVFLNFPRLVRDPASLLFSRGGMVWYGGFLLATAVVLWYIRRRRLAVGLVADLAAPALAIGYAVGRIGCFLVGDDWGRPTASWVGIRFPMGTPPTRVDVIEREFGLTVAPELVQRFGEVVPVHPTQLYEVALSTLIFLFLWRIRRHGHARGWLFMVWLSLAGAERFLVEFFRAKDDRFFGIITLAQLISLGLIAVGIWGALALRGRGERPAEA